MNCTVSSLGEALSNCPNQILSSKQASEAQNSVCCVQRAARAPHVSSSRDSWLHLSTKDTANQEQPGKQAPPLPAGVSLREGAAQGLTRPEVLRATREGTRTLHTAPHASINLPVTALPSLTTLQ